MLIDRANCVNIVDPKSGVFDGVILEPMGTISTDGKAILAVPVPAVDPSHFPGIKGGAKADAVVGDTTILPLSMVEKISKVIPKAPYQRTLEHAAVEVSDGEVIISVTDFTDAQTIRSRARELGSKTKAVKDFIPRWSERPIRVVVDLERLRDLVSAMIAASRNRGQRDHLAMIGFSTDADARERTPMIIGMVGVEAKGITGVLMPYRVKHTPTDEPWHPCENATIPEPETEEASE